MLTNFCSQKLVVEIQKCEKCNTKKGVTVVELWAIVFLTNCAIAFSISCSKSIRKLSSVISLVDYILPLFFCKWPLHVIWSHNVVYFFTHKKYKFTYISFMHTELIFQAICKFFLLRIFLHSDWIQSEYRKI